MDRAKIIETLNNAIMEELTAIFQYLQHHYLAKGLESPSVSQLFKELSIEEMKHAYDLSERVVALGGIPTIKVNPIKVPQKLMDMIRQNRDDEIRAVELYRKYIKDVGDDVVTRRMLEEILADEEEFLAKLEALIE